jgi:hypothetical protein
MKNFLKYVSYESDRLGESNDLTVVNKCTSRVDFEQYLKQIFFLNYWPLILNDNTVIKVHFDL